MYHPVLKILAIAMTLALLATGCSGPAAPTPEFPTPTIEAVPATPEAATPEAATAEPVAPTQSTDTATTTAVSGDSAPADSGAAAAPSTAAMRTFAIVPEQSTASYQVDEEFFGQSVDFVKTVGSTQAIEGKMQMQIDGSSLTVGENEFIVDLRTLTSDRPRRDNAIRTRWLESNTYPYAVFTATDVSDLPADAALGQDVNFKLNGNLTVREIPQPVTWDVTAKLDGETVSGTATTLVYMRDFGFEPPDIAGMLRVTDGVSVTLNFVAQEVK